MWTKVLWAPSPHPADGQLSGIVRASVSVRGTLVGGFFGWLRMWNRRLIFGNTEWLFSRAKKRGKPFEPVAIPSMNQKYSQLEADILPRMVSKNYSQQTVFFAREVFTQELSFLRWVQVQLFGHEATQPSAFTTTSVSLFLFLLLILGILSLLLFDRTVGDHDRRGDGGRHAANVSLLAFFLAIFSFAFAFWDTGVLKYPTMTSKLLSQANSDLEDWNWGFKQPSSRTFCCVFGEHLIRYRQVFVEWRGGFLPSQACTTWDKRRGVWGGWVVLRGGGGGVLKGSSLCFLP